MNCSIRYLWLLPATTLAFDLSMAQWVQTNGLVGQHVSALANVPASATGEKPNLFAGTLDGGTLRSTDDGATWTVVNSGLANTSVRALAVIGTQLFAGTAGGGVFVSTNSGAIWAPCNDGLMNLDIHSLIVRGDTLLAGTSGGGVFLLSIGGGRWADVSIGPAAGEVRSLAFSPGVAEGSDGSLFAGTASAGIFRSTSDGASWTAVNDGLTSSEVHALAAGRASGGAGASFVMAGTSDGVFRSVSDGSSWTRVETRLTKKNVRSLVVCSPYLLAGADSGDVAFSIDDGTRWGLVPEGLLITDAVVSLLVRPPAGWLGYPTIFAGTSGGGVVRAAGTGQGWIPRLTISYISALAFKDSVLFAGTALGVVYRSKDAGSSWSAASVGLPGVNAFAPYGNRLLVATNGGVFSSTDEGTTWAPLNNGLTTLYVSAFAVSGNVLFAGTLGGGVFRSLDSGATWIAANTGLGLKTVRCLAFGGSRLFAGTSLDGVFMSADSGMNWIYFGPWRVASVKALTVSGPYLFAGLGSSDVYRIPIGGGVWVRQKAGLTDSPLALAAGRPADSPAVRNLFAGTMGGGVFRSTDEGQNWSQLGPPNASVCALALFPDSAGSDEQNLFAAVQGAGVYICRDTSLAWNSLNTTLSATSVLSLCFHKPHLLAGTLGSGVFHSTDNGGNWTVGNRSITNVRALASATDSGAAGITTFFAGTFQNGLFVSTDNGSGWSPAGFQGTRISAITTTPSRGGSNILNLFVGTTPGVTVLTGSGVTWQVAWSEYLFGRSVYALVACIDSGATTGTAVYAGTSGRVFRSRDDGKTWVYVGQGLSTPYVYGLAVLPGFGESEPIRLAAGTWGGGVFVSSDSGLTWNPMNSGLGDLSVYALTTAGGNLFAGTYQGVYLSTDCGANWTDVSNGLTTPFVCSLAAGDSDLFAGTSGGGVWRRALSEMVTSVAESAGPIPRSISLEQNYPNPFNPSTTIRFDLPLRAPVALTVHNTLGQEVARLANGVYEAGSHIVVWNGRNFASGVYFYRLNAGELFTAKKMILLK